MVLWLAVIAPGHTRGKISTESRENKRIHSCCAPRPDSGDQPRRKPDPVRHCALCYLNANLDLPVTIDLTSRLTGLLERLSPETAQTIHVPVLVLPISGRGPPAIV